MTTKTALAVNVPLTASIVVYPVRRGVMVPVVSTLRVKGFTVLQLAAEETSWVDPSVNVRMADSLVGLVPINTDDFPGMTCNDNGIGGPMVSWPEFNSNPEVPVTVTVPCFNVVTSPLVPTVASVLSEVDQFTAVSGWEEPVE